jgi:hypothetical protein
VCSFRAQSPKTIRPPVAGAVERNASLGSGCRRRFKGHPRTGAHRRSTDVLRRPRRSRTRAVKARGASRRAPATLCGGKKSSSGSNSKATPSQALGYREGAVLSLLLGKVKSFNAGDSPLWMFSIVFGFTPTPAAHWLSQRGCKAFYNGDILKGLGWCNPALNESKAFWRKGKEGHLNGLAYSSQAFIGAA